MQAADRGAAQRHLGLAAFSTIATVVALVGLAGAWFTRIWGPRLYVFTALISLILGLVLSEGGLSPLDLVGVVLAAVLWINAENRW